MKSSYKFKFFLNASHAIRWQDGIGEAHPHTYELICEVELKEFLKFNDIEDKVHEVLDPLEGQFLNDLDFFKETNPTLEKLTYYLFDQIDKGLADLDCQLIRLEVGESPTRYFCLEK
jgi:6-pyruvoyltetrahydropterin/6-carboxytetrahydropterin synthase